MKRLILKVNPWMMMVIARMTPSCEVIGRKISESMDHQCSLRDRMIIKIHLFGCILCERYRRQLLAIEGILNRYAQEVEAGPGIPEMTLSREARARIGHALKGDEHC